MLDRRFNPIAIVVSILAGSFALAGCGIQLRSLSGHSKSSAAILNLSPTAVPFSLRYGLQNEDYVSFCILKNNTNVDDCVWLPGQLPASFDPGTHGTYVLSVWTKDAHGVISARMDTNPVQYVAPVASATKNIYGHPSASFTIGFSNANASDLRLKFRDIHTSQVVYTSTVSGSGGVTLPSVAGLYNTELVDTARGGISYGFATVTETISSWAPTQAWTPAAFGAYRAWPDYTRAVGDYNNDGRLDFAYAEGTNGGGATVAPGIYLYKFNTGTGQYAYDTRLVSTHSYIYGLQFVDIDDDGWLDLVYGRTDLAAYSSGLCYMMNTAGTFGAPTCLMDSGTSATNRTYVYELAVGDIDRDGKPDVVLGGGKHNGSAFTESRVWYFHNTGSGYALDSVISETSTQRFTDLKIADMDDDGKLDIVALIGDDTALSQLVVYPQDWSGFTAATARKTATAYGGVFALGYLNSDAKPDVVVTSQGNSNGGYYLQSNASDNTYASSTVTSPTEQFGGQNWVADLTLDGTPEIYFGGKNRLLYVNKTGIYFRTAATFSAGITVSAANSIQGSTAIGGWAESNFDFADLDGDGVMDILYFACSPMRFEYIKGQ